MGLAGSGNPSLTSSFSQRFDFMPETFALVSQAGRSEPRQGGYLDLQDATQGENREELKR